MMQHPKIICCLSVVLATAIPAYSGPSLKDGGQRVESSSAVPADAADEDLLQSVSRTVPTVTCLDVSIERDSDHRLDMQLPLPLLRELARVAVRIHGALSPVQ